MFEGIPTWPDAGRLWNIIDKYKVNILYTVPNCHKKPDGIWTSTITKQRSFFFTGIGYRRRAINEEAWHWHDEHIGKKKCPLVDTWWQTENGGILISNMAGITSAKPSWATLPLPGM